MLVEAGDIENIQAVVQRADDERADEGACDAAFAAGETGAAEDDCRDGVEFIAHAGGRLRGVQAGGEDSARKRAEEAGDGVGDDLHAVDLDAGDEGDFFVAAHGVGLTAEGGLIEDKEEHKECDEHEDRRYGNARDIALAEAHKDRVVGEAADGVAVRVDEGRAAVDGHGGQGRDEGGDFAVGDDDAVHDAQAETDHGCHDDGHFRIHAAGDHAGEERAGERKDAPYGEVDAAREDDEGHAEGDERIDGDLTEQVAQVRRGDEAVIERRDDDEEENEPDERPHFSQQIFCFFRVHWLFSSRCQCNDFFLRRVFAAEDARHVSFVDDHDAVAHAEDLRKV